MRSNAFGSNTVIGSRNRRKARVVLDSPANKSIDLDFLAGNLSIRVMASQECQNLWWNNQIEYSFNWEWCWKRLTIVFESILPKRFRKETSTYAFEHTGRWNGYSKSVVFKTSIQLGLTHQCLILRGLCKTHKLEKGFGFSKEYGNDQSPISKSCMDWLPKKRPKSQDSGNNFGNDLLDFPEILWEKTGSFF